MQHIPLHWGADTILLLYTGAMMRDLAVEEHSTWNRLALNCLYRTNTTSTPVIHQRRCTTCLTFTSPLPSKWTFSYLVMSACCNLRLCSPLKTVLNKLGDSYQTYINTHKMHAMATHHRGTGQPLDRDPTPHAQGTDIPSDYHHEDTYNFENVEHENHTTLKALSWDLDDLWYRVETAKGQPTEAISHLEHKLHWLSLALCSSAPPKPLYEVLQQYTEILCSAQKQTTFANTLIQDIPTFNGSNSMQLEDWLVDIETAGNLTDESRTKLAQAKSKGLTHTLKTEALTSGKCWEEIKDLLHLKICNSDIHTSVSHFMDIQQRDKESLAAYIHRFKREVQRCNFTNNVVTIRIFVKGLKNAHTLAAYVYEKGPQTLADAISKVEKLQAVQQLTATLLPSSTGNVMSNKEEQFFQCQELGHITHHCPNVHCVECDEYGHIAADCPDRIPPSGMPACQKRQNSNTRHHPRSTSRHCHQDRYRHSRSRSHPNSHRYWSCSQNNSHRSHSRSHHRCHHGNTSWHCHYSTYCYCHDTPHRRSSSHISSLTHSRDHSRSTSHTLYKPSKNTLSKSSSSYSRTTVKLQDKKLRRVMIDGPQSDYCSSDDTSSDSEDDLN